jgi:REP element-mobilizing transposase RayT
LSPDNHYKNHHRRSIRLKDYDYSRRGAYFVTVCTRNKQPLFGEIIDGVMHQNDVAEIARKYWLEIPNHFSNVTLDQFVIMPNHVHGIIVITDDMVGAKHASPLRSYKTKIHGAKPKSLGTIIASFKSATTKQINLLLKTPGNPHWQRNYYEHIIRNEQELNKIKRYIINNPPRWEYDRENRNGIPNDEKIKFWDRFLNEFE